jgi:hypothetical protein
MIIGLQLYFGWAISRRLRGEILRRERNAKWLKEAVKSWTCRIFQDGRLRGIRVVRLRSNRPGAGIWNWWAARRCEPKPRSAARRGRLNLPGRTPMTPRQKRMVTVAAILAGVGIATRSPCKAFNQNLLYYYSPTQIQRGRSPGFAQHPRRRAGRERQRQARAGQPRGQVHAHRLPATWASATRASCRTCSAKGRASSPAARSVTTVCSSPKRCWPSTTRTTCRPK